VGTSGNNAEAIEAELAQRISDYVEVLTVHRDADLAGDYYTEDARLVGPGMDLDRLTLVEGIRETFEAGIQVQVNRRTLEVFVHGDVAYEIAQAEDVFLRPDGATADTSRNNMFIRWQRGEDGEWRFHRALLSPIDAAGQ
jgi:ketosteroid isomerase-like protein